MKQLLYVLVASTISLNAMHPYQQILIEAAQAGSFKLFMTNLPRDVNPNFIQDCSGMDIAMHAVANGQDIFLKHFLRNFDVYFRKDIMNRTAFSIAAAGNQHKCLSILLKYINKKNQGYPNLLSRSMALAREYDSKESLELLEGIKTNK